MKHNIKIMIIDKVLDKNGKNMAGWSKKTWVRKVQVNLVFKS